MKGLVGAKGFFSCHDTKRATQVLQKWPEKVPLALRTLHGRRQARPRSILVLPLLLRKSHQTRQPVPVHMTVENL